MSEKTNQMLIRMLNELTGIETEISKVEASIFLKKIDKLIKEKISYLYSILQAESDFYNLKSDRRFKYIEKIISTYREKLNAVYDEIYLQYVNIQNELGEARLAQKATIVNYQKVLNDFELTNRRNDELKDKIKNKNDLYEEIVKKCEVQYEVCISNFDEQLNANFLMKIDLPILSDALFSKIKNKIYNLFFGNSKFEKSMKMYERTVNNIDTQKINDNIRKQTIKFVTDILEMKDVSLDEAVWF